MHCRRSMCRATGSPRSPLRRAIAPSPSTRLPVARAISRIFSPPRREGSDGNPSEPATGRRPISQEHIVSQVTWGIVPAAGQGSRMQPLAFSKELLPVGSRAEGDRERPRAVSEYLVERLVLGGADKICFVISPGKSDILEYYGGSVFSAELFYAVQPRPAGLCDAVFRAAPLIGRDDFVLVGLPDTVWYPEDALAHLPDAPLSFLCFPVQQPQFFDAVVADEGGHVEQIQVKQREARS